MFILMFNVPIHHYVISKDGRLVVLDVLNVHVEDVIKKGVEMSNGGLILHSFQLINLRIRTERERPTTELNPTRDTRCDRLLNKLWMN